MTRSCIADRTTIINASGTNSPVNNSCSSTSSISCNAHNKRRTATIAENGAAPTIANSNNVASRDESGGMANGDLVGGRAAHSAGIRETVVREVCDHVQFLITEKPVHDDDNDDNDDGEGGTKPTTKRAIVSEKNNTDVTGDDLDLVPDSKSVACVCIYIHNICRCGGGMTETLYQY